MTPTAFACFLMACLAGVLAESGEPVRVWPMLVVVAGCLLAVFLLDLGD